MARYDQWRRLSGDTASRPDLLDVGKKLLGYLAEQRRLGGSATQSIQRRMPDGSIVQARIIGEIPSIHIEAARPSGAPPAGGLLVGGFVTRPRQYGTAAGADGQDYFGDKAHVIARYGQDWTAHYFDADYLPEDARPLLYGRTFTEGLKRFGNTDWRDAKEEVSVNWCGAISRSLPIGERDRFVFHNGEVLLDHSLIESAPYELVLGACVRVIGTAMYLYWIGYTELYDDSGSTLHLWRAPITAAGVGAAAAMSAGFPPTAAPRWEPIDPVTVELLQSIPLQDTTNASPYSSLLRIGLVAFNQSATEARAIYEGYTDSESVEVRTHELIVNLVENTHESVLRATYKTIDTTTRSYPGLTAAYVDHPFMDVVDITPHPNRSEGGGAGTYTTVYERAEFPLRAQEDTGGSFTRADGIVTSGTAARSYGSTASDIPIAVDYQDDVPVYAYWTPLSLESSAAKAASFPRTCSVLSASHVASYDVSGLSAEDEERLEEAIYAVASTLTTAATVTGGEVYAVDKDGVRWWEFQYSGSYSDSLVGEVTEATSRADTTTLIGTGPDTWEIALAQLRTHDSQRVMSADAAYTQLRIWHLDLRHRIAVTTEHTRVRHDESTVSYTGSLATNSTTTTTTDPILPEHTIGYSTPLSGLLRDNSTATSGHDTFVTKVILNGELQDSATATVAQTPSSSSTVDVPASINEEGWVLRMDSYATVRTAIQFEPGIATMGTVYGGFRHTTSSGTDAEISGAVTASLLSTPPGPVGIEDRISTVESTAKSEAPLDMNLAWNNDIANWLDTTPDIEGVGLLVNQSTRLGTWIVHRGRWAYSMAWLSGDSVAAPAWRSAIQGAAIDAALPNHLAVTPDLYECMWPLSACIKLT